MGDGFGDAAEVGQLAAGEFVSDQNPQGSGSTY